MNPGVVAASIGRLRRRPVGRYGLAVLATALATFLKLAFPHVIGHGAPVAIYLGVVMLAAWFGGMGPGLLSTALFMLAWSYWFAAPFDSFEVAEPRDAVRLLLGVLEGVTIALLAGALHRATDAAAARAEQLARSNDELRREIEARARAESSLERTTEQLLHSQKMQAIGALAGGVAHDFNNLLSVILNYSALILARLGPTDPTREFVDEIHGAGERAATLTRRLLAFARKAIVEPRVIDLNEAVAGLERILRTLLGHSVEVTIHFAPTPAPIFADAMQIEQMVTNLVVNARDAMPSGGRITITTALVSLAGDGAQARGVRDGDYVELTIADTGVGMPSEVVGRIFEPFFTTKDVGQGTGLGLAIVHGVVTRAGGEIAVESAEGHGTTFTVLLPRSSCVTAPIAAPRAPGNGSRRGRILVVEDDAAVRRSTVAVLGQLGYQVRAAGSADEALATWQRDRDDIDLVLTDVAMPVMNGIALAEQLRRAGATVPIVFVSGFARDGALHGHELPPGARIVQKPLTPGALDEALRASLGS